MLFTLPLVNPSQLSEYYSKGNTFYCSMPLYSLCFKHSYSPLTPVIVSKGRSTIVLIWSSYCLLSILAIHLNDAWNSGLWVLSFVHLYNIFNTHKNIACVKVCRQFLKSWCGNNGNLFMELNKSWLAFRSSSKRFIYKMYIYLSNIDIPTAGMVNNSTGKRNIALGGKWV